MGIVHALFVRAAQQYDEVSVVIKPDGPKLLAARFPFDFPEAIPEAAKLFFVPLDLGDKTEILYADSKLRSGIGIAGKP
jgi:hypothetical protein